MESVAHLAEWKIVALQVARSIRVRLPKLTYYGQRLYEKIFDE